MNIVNVVLVLLFLCGSTFFTIKLLGKKGKKVVEGDVDKNQASGLKDLISSKKFFENKVFLFFAWLCCHFGFFYSYFILLTPGVGEYYFPKLYPGWLYFWSIVFMGFFVSVMYYLVLATVLESNENIRKGYTLICYVGPLLVLFFIFQNSNDYFDRLGKSKAWIYEEGGVIKEIYWYDIGSGNEYGGLLRPVTRDDVERLKAFRKRSFSFGNFFSSEGSKKLTILEQGYIRNNYDLGGIGKENDLARLKITCPRGEKYCVYLEIDKYTIGSPVVDGYVQKILADGIVRYIVKRGDENLVRIKPTLLRKTNK